jgi:hypothetical protein
LSFKIRAICENKQREIVFGTRTGEIVVLTPNQDQSIENAEKIIVMRGHY